MVNRSATQPPTPSSGRRGWDLPARSWSAARGTWLRPAALLLLLLLCAAPSLRAQPAESPGDPLLQLGFIDRLYGEGERFRAESEILRFLHDHPGDPHRDAAELARAKLYFQERRYGESALMLRSLLDRMPRGEAAPDARRLLAYAEVMAGRPAEAAAALRPEDTPAERLALLAALAEPPEDAADPDTAVAWSTALPGTGFFLLDQPGKATAALTLNLAFAAGAVIAYRQQNYGAALVLALVEIALYSGGRQAVRQEAERLLARRQNERREEWIARDGAPELLAVGIRLDFGGR